MRIRKETKKAFISKYRLKTISLEDVIDFYEPYMDLDPEKAIEKLKKDMARRLIAVKDENGNRIFISFKLNGKTLYSNPDAESNLDVLNAMNNQLKQKIKGLQITRKIVTRRKRLIVDGQVSMFGDKKQ